MQVEVSNMLIPTVRCSQLRRSMEFYTGVLDFEMAEEVSDDTDPGAVVLRRGNAFLILSSHKGDGTFGQAVSIATDDVDAVFQAARARGLQTPGDPRAPTEVHEGPINQSWGTREFYVDDPDRNTLRYVKGFTPKPDSGA